MTRAHRASATRNDSVHPRAIRLAPLLDNPDDVRVQDGLKNRAHQERSRPRTRQEETAPRPRRAEGAPRHRIGRGKTPVALIFQGFASIAPSAPRRTRSRTWPRCGGTNRPSEERHAGRRVPEVSPLVRTERLDPHLVEAQDDQLNGRGPDRPSRLRKTPKIRIMSVAHPAIPTDVPLNLFKVKQPGVARVVANLRLTPEDRDDVRHVVLDLSGLDYRYLEGQSLGVLAPGVDEKGKPHKLRLYSIASTRSGDDGQGRLASLCVKRLVYEDPVTGEPRYGVASNYLCDLKPGDEVRVTGPSGKHFLLPEDPEANLILVATGTGIAPYRAFLRRIYKELPEWRGLVRLIFGVRTAAECLYLRELEFYADRPGYRLVTAFSREQTTTDGKRMYVQHRMAEAMEDLWPLLERDETFLYICGLKGMEDGIEDVLRARAEAEGVDYRAFRERLSGSGRLLIETY